jgi:hypothetical protein
MAPDIVSKMVAAEFPDLPTHLHLRKVNECMLVNGADTMTLPFAEVDIRYCEFMDFLKVHATQREKDMVIVSERFYRGWKALHITAQTLGEPLTPGDTQDLEMLVPSLQRLDLLHLLNDGLKPKWRKLVQKMGDLQ